MLKELISNACILVTILFVASQIFQKNGLNPTAPVKTKVLLGLVGGISAMILIYFSIHVSEKIVLDFRHIIEILVAIFGGLLSVTITGIITAAFRLLYQGISTESIFAAISIMLVSVGCGWFSRFKFQIKLKLVLMFSYSLLIRSIIYLILLEEKQFAILVIFVFCASSVLVGAAVIYLVNYLINSYKMLNRLKQDSCQDFLTGLTNTRQFDLKYNEVLCLAEEKKSKVTVLILDIDHFKNVNDTYGHLSGDEVLRELGCQLQALCGHMGFASRIGGEEFAIVLQDFNKKQSMELAERIRATIEGHPFVLSNEIELHITISVGVAIYPVTVQDASLLKETADNKLYEAKRTGRNKVCI